MLKFTLFLFLLPAVFNTDLKNIHIENLKISPCINTNYLIRVNNVSVDIVNKKVKFSGTLSSEIDIASPIHASVIVKRWVLVGWIEVPCEKNIGSCNYQDLCKFGYPLKKSCPEAFKKNEVPCRCPISKGNYTIEPSINLYQAISPDSILSGSYKGSVTLSSNSSILSCYNFEAKLTDNSNIPKVYRI